MTASFLPLFEVFFALTAGEMTRSPFILQIFENFTLNDGSLGMVPLNPNPKLPPIPKAPPGVFAVPVSKVSLCLSKMLVRSGALAEEEVDEMELLCLLLSFSSLLDSEGFNFTGVAFDVDGGAIRGFVEDLGCLL